MSYIRETIKCPCGKFMNISLGTFGGGWPVKCAHCDKHEKFEVVNDNGWYADEWGNFSDDFENKIKS